MTDNPARSDALREDEACVFVPAHEPWSCSTHVGGYRTLLTEDRCSVAAVFDIHPLTDAELAEFDAWAEARRGKPASQGMLWALRLRATLAVPAAEPRMAPWCPDCTREGPCAVCAAAAQPGPSEAGLRPEIVVLCGSTRFYDDFQQANYDLTMAGRIVLSVGFYPHSKAVHGHGEGVGHDSAQKVALDELHKRKIDLADRVYVLNRDGYIGDSTRSEIEYAERSGKPVAYAFDVDGVRSTIDGWPCPRHDAALAHVGHHSCEKHS